MVASSVALQRYRTFLIALQRGLSLKVAAAVAETSVRTAQRWRREGPPGTAGRPEGDTVRAKLAARIARRTIVKDGRKHPLFPSAPRVAAQLRQEYGYSVGPCTVLRDLRSLGFRTLVRPKHPNLSNGPVRLAFARKWKRLNQAYRFVFSDEHFISTNDNSLRTMLVAPGAQAIPREVQRRQNVPNFQIWAAIGVGYRSPLIFFPKVSENDDRDTPGGFRLNCRSYVRRCLQYVAPYLSSHDVIFMQDGARCHWAKNVLAYLEGKGIEVLHGFPASSPDLNPIETLWGILDRRIAEHYPRTSDELKAIALKVWDEIPQEIIDNLVRSFQGKCERVVRNNGV